MAFTNVKLSNIEVDHHRNVVSGVGFYVALFDSEEYGKSTKMVGVIFPEAGEVAVFNLEKLCAGDIQFGSNSFRGDVFEGQLRDAIKEMA